MLQRVHQLCRAHVPPISSRRRSRSLSTSPLSFSEESRTLIDAGGTLFASVVDLVQFGAFVAFFTKYCANITQCTGPSMLPTISTKGDVLLTVPTRFRQLFGMDVPQLDDVVISISPSDPTQTVCKRILGMPGDELRAAPPPGWPADYGRTVTVPQGHVWLQGDNTDDSTDSRSYGPVPIALIQAVVVCRLYPLRDAGRLPALSPERASILTSRQRGNPPERRVEPTIRLPLPEPLVNREPPVCDSTVTAASDERERQRLALSLVAPGGVWHTEADGRVGHVEIAELPAVQYDSAFSLTTELESLLPVLREAAARSSDAELIEATVQLVGAANELQAALQRQQRPSGA